MLVLPIGGERLTAQPRLALDADDECRHAWAAGFATLIVIVVFLPLFGMSGIEGRMYQPLAAAVIAAMVAALILALTVVPVVAAATVKPSHGS